MDIESKELVFKYLCMALPHHIKVKVWLADGTTEEGFLDLEHNYKDVLLDAFYYGEIKEIKPYLRSLNTITKEERQAISKLIKENRPSPYGEINPNGMDNLILSVAISCGVVIEWLLENHFDFMQLIPKGLAIEKTI
jgi:hypothetical protein